MKHLIFYDDACPFCQRCIQKIVKIDHQKIFTNAPLNGKIANEILQGELRSLKNKNTLILMEKSQTAKVKIWIRAKAVFRIFYLVGGKYKIIGIFCFLPSFLIDPFYRLIARYR